MMEIEGGSERERAAGEVDLRERIEELSRGLRGPSREREEAWGRKRGNVAANVAAVQDGRADVLIAT